MGKLCHWSVGGKVYVSWQSANIKGIKCYEVKIEESEKAGSCRESSPGHLWLEPPVLCHWATTARQPPTHTILYMYCTGSTECLSCTPGNHSIFCLITSKFIYFQREARCSEHQRDCIVLLGCPLFSRCPNFLDFYSFFFRCLDFIDVFSYPGFPDVLVFQTS